MDTTPSTRRAVQEMLPAVAVLNNSLDIKAWMTHCLEEIGDFPGQVIGCCIKPIKTLSQLEQLRDWRFISNENVSEWWGLIENKTDGAPGCMNRNSLGLWRFRACQVTPEFKFISVFCQRQNGVDWVGVFEGEITR